MQKLEKIYKNSGLEKPIIDPSGKKDYLEPNNSVKVKLGKETFFINWDIIDSIVENYSTEDGDSNQIEDFFSNEKMIEEDIIYSSKIEGINLLKEDEKKSNTEEKEIKLDYKKVNAEAYSFLFAQKKIDHDVLEEVKNIFNKSSKLLNMESMTPAGSRYRNDKVGIYKKSNGHDVKIHEGIEWEKISEALDDVFKYFNGHQFDKNFPPTIAIRVGVTHCLFEYIHPYFDGNGRIGRMLINWLIRQTDFPEASYFLSNVIDNNKSKYYQSLEHSQKTKDLSYHSAFIFAAMNESIEIYVKLIRILSEIRLTKTQFEFVKKLLVSGMNMTKISYPEIKSKFNNQSRQSFYKMADSLVDLGVLEKDDRGKINFYSINKVLIK